jgi:hypothetical protein
MSASRSFPGPWRVEVTEGGHFVVKDSTGFSVCYVYARKDEALGSSYLTHAEAVVMAEQIARLPELAIISHVDDSAQLELAAVYPDTMAPIVRLDDNGARNLTMMRWGFPRHRRAAQGR